MINDYMLYLYNFSKNTRYFNKIFIWLFFLQQYYHSVKVNLHYRFMLL